MTNDDHRAKRAASFREQADAETNPVTRAEYVIRTRRAVLTGATAAAVTGLGWGWLQRMPESGNIPALLRRGFELNEAVWSTLYDPGRLAPEFTLADAEPIRVNGTRGLAEEIDLDAWSLRVEDADGAVLDELDLDAVLAGLPLVEQVTEHKCIEGWSNIVHWTGVRFADVVSRYESAVAGSSHVALETPDGEYYVGLDTDTVMHPQSLLATSLNGEALTQDHGAPLRLVTPLHYGIKSLKRVGVIRFATDRPRDFWAERGYDWDSSH